MAVCLLGVPSVAASQETAAGQDIHPIFIVLEGVWEGTGVLLDRAAEFHMEWPAGPGRFVRLSFASAGVGEGGATTPILQSEAVYLPLESTAQGVWIDSRPQRIQLEAIMSDSSLITTWTADLEQGRTGYIVSSSTEVLVLDQVVVDGVLRLFGEAWYRGRDPPLDSSLGGHGR